MSRNIEFKCVHTVCTCTLYKRCYLCICIYIYIPYIYLYLCLFKFIYVCFLIIFVCSCFFPFIFIYVFKICVYVYFMFLCIFIHICLYIFICICLFLQYDVITCNNPIFQHIHMCFLIYWSAISASLHTFVGGASGPGSRLRTRAEAKVWAQQLGSLERHAAGRWGRMWPMGAILAGKNVMK